MKRIILIVVGLLVSIESFCQYPDLRNNLNMDRSTQWYKLSDETVIPVCWENGEGFTEEKLIVRYAAESSWQATANVRFTGWGNCTSNSKGIRILVSDEHPHTKGLGRMLDGRQSGMVLNFTFQNWDQPAYRKARKQAIFGIAVHEFGHALGVAHEHNRPGCNPCFAEPGGSAGGYYVTPCDKFSVMNYCNDDPKAGTLTEFDKAGIRMIYGPKITKNVQGVIWIEDRLGETDSFENVLVEFGGHNYSFHIDTANPIDSRKFNFQGDKTGGVRYKVWTTTQRKTGEYVYGFGEGFVVADPYQTNRYSLHGTMQSDGKYRLEFK